jgi:hypothetical protein
MAKIRFDIPVYDRAMSTFAVSVVDGIVALDPLVGQIRKGPTVHGGSTRNVPGPAPVDHPLISVEHAGEYHIDVVRYTDIERFASMLYEIAGRHRSILQQHLFQVISEVCDGTGNVIDARGKELTYDLVLDLLEQMPIHFDADGSPSIPQIVMGPEPYGRLARVPPTPEQLRRQEDILRRKRAEHDAQKRHRRLSQ